MTIEERMKAILEKIAEIKAGQTGGDEKQLEELDAAYREGVDSV